MPKMENPNPEMHVDLMFPAATYGLRTSRKPVSLTISEVLKDKVQMATGQKAEKYILRFRETDKELILNKTNAKAVAKTSTSRVPSTGGKIVLHHLQAFGEIVDCIRVRCAGDLVSTDHHG